MTVICFVLLYDSHVPDARERYLVVYPPTACVYLGLIHHINYQARVSYTRLRLERIHYTPPLCKVCYQDASGQRVLCICILYALPGTLNTSERLLYTFPRGGYTTYILNASEKTQGIFTVKCCTGFLNVCVLMDYLFGIILNKRYTDYYRLLAVRTCRKYKHTCRMYSERRTPINSYDHTGE